MFSSIDYWKSVFIFSPIAIVTLVYATAGRADALWLRNRVDPIYGIFVSETTDEVSFEQWDENTSSFALHTFSKQDVRSLLRNYDPERLSTLDPNQTASYLDYAEELAPMKSDPIARDLAVRLALLAAANSSGAARDSALCVLADAARNPAEREKFTTLKYLYSTSAVELRTNQTNNELTPESRSQLLQALQALRRGQRENAKRLFANDNLEIVLGRITDRVTIRDLRQWTTMTQLSGRQLAELITLELRLTRSEVAIRPSQSVSWATDADRDRLGRGEVPSFSTVTEFEPTKSVFRNGEWQMPDE